MKANRITTQISPRDRTLQVVPRPIQTQVVQFPANRSDLEPRPLAIITRRWRSGDAEHCRLCPGGCSAEVGPDGASLCTIIVPDNFPGLAASDLAMYESRTSLAIDPGTREPVRGWGGDYDCIDGVPLTEEELAM